MANNLEESFDIELFIGKIKNYLEIWNISAETYHDRQKKRGTWIKICRVFCEGFDEKDEKDRNEICPFILPFLLHDTVLTSDDEILKSGFWYEKR